MRGMSELSSRDAQKSYVLFVEDDFEDLTRYLTDSDNITLCRPIPGVLSWGDQTEECCDAGNAYMAKIAIDNGDGNLIPGGTCLGDPFDGCDGDGKTPVASSVSTASGLICADNKACAVSLIAGLTDDTTGGELNTALLQYIDTDDNDAMDLCTPVPTPTPTPAPSECQMLPGMISMGNQQAGCCAAASSLVATAAISRGMGNTVPETCFADVFYGCEAEGPFAGRLPTAQSVAAATYGFCAYNFACATSILAGLSSDTTGANLFFQ